MKTVSEFMLNLHKRLTEDKKLAESTAKQYIQMLRKLNSDVPFNNFSFLKSKELLVERIAEYSENTQKTYYSMIVSVLSFVKDKSSYKATYNFYYEKMMGKAKEHSEKDTSEKSETQKKNWLSWAEVTSKFEALKEQVAEFKGAKLLTNSNYDTLLSAIILSLYVCIPPRRNQDYQDLYAVKKLTDKHDKTKNYYDIATQRFVFNKYKTSKTYGEQVIDISENEELLDLIKVFLKFHPAKKSNEFRFLVFHDGTPLTAVNAVTRILNRVFGKNIGSSMLRHIYLSDKYNIDELKEDAKAMGHSVSQQREYMKSEKPSEKSAEKETDE
jgi:integrase